MLEKFDERSASGPKGSDLENELVIDIQPARLQRHCHSANGCTKAITSNMHEGVALPYYTVATAIDAQSTYLGTIITLRVISP